MKKIIARSRLVIGFIATLVGLTVAWRWLPMAAGIAPGTGITSDNLLPDAQEAHPAGMAVDAKIWLPLILGVPGTVSGEWSQHAHNAQRTGYTPQVVDPPWRWRWAWNGPDSSGGIAKVTSNGRLPRNVQPVTGGGRVYVAAGASGVFALHEATGAQAWHQATIGAINSTVAYDHETQALFVVSANGRLYKLNAANGTVLDDFNTGASSSLPLPPAILSDRVLFAMGNHVYAVNKQTLGQLWQYDAGVAVETPPAYSVSRDRIIVATADLYVHAIHNTNGAQAWRVRPVHPSLAAGQTPDGQNFAEFRRGWPVVADNAGYVLLKARLDWQTLWTWSPWPINNSQMRANLTAQPAQQALFVLDLDDGSVPFIANIGHGGYGDGGYMPMGPQPVVKTLPNGKDVVYTIIRGHTSQDGRWDSHFGEMMLDSTTVSGLQGGDVRFIAYDYPPGAAEPTGTYLLTDEQPNVSMAGDYLFGGHWEAGFALRLLDRSDARGTFTNKITSQRLATIATSQDGGGCAFSPSHYCSSGLQNTRYYDTGFYIYYGQGAVYDQYWSEYATWVVSNDNIYFRSTDGALVALTRGNPTVGQILPVAMSAPAPDPAPDETAVPVNTIPYTAAAAWAGQPVTVYGELRYIFNNGKDVLLGFAHPHQGSFKALIGQQAWAAFSAPPEALYQIGQSVQVTGHIAWYQGDPAIFVTSPAQISHGRLER